MNLDEIGAFNKLHIINLDNIKFMLMLMLIITLKESSQYRNLQKRQFLKVLQISSYIRLTTEEACL